MNFKKQLTLIVERQLMKRKKTIQKNSQKVISTLQ